jgi:CheY-like chemotaxis protein
LLHASRGGRRECLGSAGLRFEAQIASDGEKALALIERSAEASGAPLDGMILDLNLTTHSGIEILRRVRAIPALAGLSVVILTSSDSRDDRRQAELVGTNGYFRKPIELEDFMQMGREISEVFNKASRG